MSFVIVSLHADSLQAVITTSPKCSEEKLATIRAYGAELLVRGSKYFLARY